MATSPLETRIGVGPASMQFHRPDPLKQRVCSTCGDEAMVPLGARCPHDGAVFVDGALASALPLGGRYRLIEPLAEGAFAQVSVAADGRADTSMGRLVAIKRLLTHLRTDSDASSRFEREGELLDRLKDVPGVVRLVERGKTGTGEPFLALEYLDGRTLEEVLGSYGRFEVRPAALVILALLRTLDGVHRAGLVHRDLKPSNIMMMAIRDEARLRLLDFGIARDPGQSDNRLTAPNRTLGTPSYMSPEQWGSSSVDERSDLYSLGIIFYHLLTGRLPFDGDADQVGNQHRGVAPPPFDEVLNIPPAVIAVVDKALAKLPELRFQTAHAFYDALAFAVGMPDFHGAPPTERLGPEVLTAASTPPRFVGQLPRSTAQLELSPPETLQGEQFSPETAAMRPASSDRMAVPVLATPPLLTPRRLARAIAATVICFCAGLAVSWTGGADDVRHTVEISEATAVESTAPAVVTPGAGRATVPHRVELGHGVDAPAVLALPVVKTAPATRDRICIVRNAFTGDCVKWGYR